MAKDKLVSDPTTNDPELDFDFDDGGMDFGIDQEAQSPKDRHPVLNVLAGTLGGTLDYAKNPETYKQIAKRTLPSTYGDVATGVSDTTKGIQELYDQTKKEVKPRLNQLVKRIDDLFPENFKTTKKILEKLDIASGGNRYNSDNREVSEEQHVQNMLGDIFKAQQLNDKASQYRDVARDDIELKRHKQQMNVSGVMARDISKMSQYTVNVQQAYQRKSLELQIRSFMLQQKTSELMYKFFARTEEQQAAIARNTGLPDWVKVTKTEAFQERMMQRTVDKLFGDGSAIQKGFSKLKGRAALYVQGITSGMDQASFQLSDMAGAKDAIKDMRAQAKEYGLSTNELTGSYMAGSNMGGMVGDWLSEKVIAKLKPLADDNPALKEWLAAGSMLAKNPAGALDKLKRSEWMKKMNEKTGWQGKAVDFGKSIADSFMDSAPERSIDVGVNSENLNNIQEGFTKKFAQSVEVVIPGYLSMILREISMQRTGSDQDVMLYDWNKQKFSTKGSMRSDIMSALKEANDSSMLGYKVADAEREIIGDQALSAQTEKDLRLLIRRMASGGNVDYSNVDSIKASTAFQSASRDAQEVFLKAYDVSSNEHKQKSAKITNAMVDVRDAHASMDRQLHGFVDAGYGNLLEEENLLKRSKSGRYFDVDETEFERLLDSNKVFQKRGYETEAWREQDKKAGQGDMEELYSEEARRRAAFEEAMERMHGKSVSERQKEHQAKLSEERKKRKAEKDGVRRSRKTKEELDAQLAEEKEDPYSDLNRARAEEYEDRYGDYDGDIADYGRSGRRDKSDINAKEDISRESPLGILDRIKGKFTAGRDGVKDFAKGKDPKKAYEAMMKTKLFAWKYKKGKGDTQEPLEGPMAQDVRRNFGNDEAPDGKSIKPQSLTASFFAAIQYLGQQNEKITSHLRDIAGGGIRRKQETGEDDATLDEDIANLEAASDPELADADKAVKAAARSRSQAKKGFSQANQRAAEQTYKLLTTLKDDVCIIKERISRLTEINEDLYSKLKDAPVGQGSPLMPQAPPGVDGSSYLSMIGGFGSKLGSDVFGKLIPGAFNTAGKVAKGAHEHVLSPLWNKGIVPAAGWGKDLVKNNYKGVLDGAMDLGKKGLGLAADTVSTHIPNAIGGLMNFGKKTWTNVSRLFKEAKDIYLPGMNFPTLQVAKMKAGEYYDEVSGKALLHMDEILACKNNIVDKAGNVVLSAKEMAAGVYDREGKRIKTGLAAGIAGAANLAVMGLKGANTLLSGVKGVLKKTFKSLGGVWDKLSIPDFSMVFGMGDGSYMHKSHDILFDIRDLMLGRKAAVLKRMKMKASAAATKLKEHLTGKSADKASEASSGVANTAAPDTGGLLGGLIGKAERFRDKLTGKAASMAGVAQPGDKGFMGPVLPGQAAPEAMGPNLPPGERVKRELMDRAQAFKDKLSPGMQDQLGKTQGRLGGFLSGLKDKFRKKEGLMGPGIPAAILHERGFVGPMPSQDKLQDENPPTTKRGFLLSGAAGILGGVGDKVSGLFNRRKQETDDDATLDADIAAMPNRDTRYDEEGGLKGMMNRSQDRAQEARGIAERDRKAKTPKGKLAKAYERLKNRKHYKGQEEDQRIIDEANLGYDEAKKNYESAKARQHQRYKENGEFFAAKDKTGVKANEQHALDYGEEEVAGYEKDVREREKRREEAKARMAEREAAKQAKEKPTAATKGGKFKAGLSKLGSKAKGLGGLAMGAVSTAASMVGGAAGAVGGSGTPSENNPNPEQEAQKEAEKNKPSLMSTVKDKLAGMAGKVSGKDKAWNDKDGSGERDGGVNEKQAKIDAIAEGRKKDFQKADTRERYGSPENVIDKMMEASKGFLGGVMGKITGVMEMASNLFQFLPGMGKIGGMLKGALTPKGLLARGAIGLAKGAWWGSKLAVVASAKGALAFAGLMGQAALSVGGVLLSAISSPVVLTVAAVAGLAYGAYKLYQYANRNNATDLERMRLRQYGLAFNSNVERYNHKAYVLEAYLEDGRVGYQKTGQAYLEQSKIKSEELLEIMGIGKADTTLASNFAGWFEKRFKPVFLSHKTALRKARENIRLPDVEKMSAREKAIYLEGVKMDQDVYNYDLSPIEGIEALDIKGDEIEKMRETLLKNANIIANKTAKKPEAVKQLPEEKEKDKKTADDALKDADKAAAAKALAEKQTEKKESTGSDWLDNAKNSGEGDGKAPPSAGQSGGEDKAIAAGAGGSPALAGGELKPGTAGLDAVVLRKGAKLDGMNPHVQKNFLGMAEEYFEKTGKKFPVNDGKRSRAEQEALYKRNPQKAAKPGRSLHEFGFALDTDSIVANEADRLGLMRKYGFTRPVGGEEWHMEPAGIQENVGKAKEGGHEADAMVINSPGRGGGGYGATKGSKLGKRNHDMAIALLNASPVKPLEDKPKADKATEGTQVAQAGTEKAVEDSSKAPSTDTKLASASSPAATQGETSKLGKGNDLPATPSSDKPSVASEGKSGGEGDGAAPPSAGNKETKVASAAGTSSSTPGGLPTAYKGGETKGEMLKVLNEAAKKAGVDPATLQVFAAQESGLRAGAANGNSSSKGLMGFIDGTWEAMLKKHGSKYGIPPGTPQTDPMASALMGAEFIKENMKAVSAVKPNPNGTDAYMAHFLGAGGAKTFFKADPNAKGVDVMPEAAAKNAPSFFRDGNKRKDPRTIAEIYKFKEDALVKRATEFGIPYKGGGGMGLKSKPEGESGTGLKGGSAGVSPNLSSTGNPAAKPDSAPGMGGSSGTGVTNDLSSSSASSGGLTANAKPADQAGTAAGSRITPREAPPAKPPGIDLMAINPESQPKRQERGSANTEGSFGTMESTLQQSLVIHEKSYEQLKLIAAALSPEQLGKLLAAAAQAGGGNQPDEKEKAQKQDDFNMQRKVMASPGSLGFSRRPS